jgi:hypothetical protein
VVVGGSRLAVETEGAGCRQSGGVNGGRRERRGSRSRPPRFRPPCSSFPSVRPRS